MNTTINREDPVFREEISGLLNQFREAVISGWMERLRADGGEDAAHGIRIVQQEQRLGKDLLSLVAESLHTGSPVEKNTEWHLVDKVRTQEYSIVDLFTEVCCLEQSIQDVLRSKASLPDAGLLRAITLVGRELQSVVKKVLENTSEIYEQVLESSSRAFCHVDEAGRILYANGQFERLAASGQLAGKPLADCFDAAHAQWVTEALRGSKPVLRPLCLRTGDGRRVVVGAEIGPLFVGRDPRGGFASLVDISSAMAFQTRVFDRSPLGIVKVNLNQEFTYANATMLRLLGTETLEGRHIRDIFDDENYAIVQKQLLKRLKGESSEYRVEFKRLSDGKQIPVMLAAMPETDLQDNVVGAVSFARSLLLEDKAAEIHLCIQTLRNAPQLLAAVTKVVRSILSFDLFNVVVYSQGRKHVRSLFHSPESSGKESPRRWLPLTDAMSDWIDEHKEPFDGDLNEFLAQEHWRPLKGDPSVQQLLATGVKFLAAIPVVRAGHVVASVTAYSRNPFNADDLEIFKRLPVEHAVLTVLNSEEEEELRFRLDLITKVSLMSNDLEQVARLVTASLAQRYGWPSVAIYQVDRSREQIRLLKQAPTLAAFQVSPGFKQSIHEGVLGHVCRHGEAVNIQDVRTDPVFKDVFLRVVSGTVSELCLPIVSEGSVRWLLNIEASAQNAFAPEEERALATVLPELAGQLERSRKHGFLQAVLGSASDAIIVTDERDVIRRANPAAESLLGCSEQEMLQQPFGGYFQDEASARNILKTSGSRTDRVWLRNRNGEPQEVLLSVSHLPEVGDGRVFTVKDLLPYKRAERLGMLEQVMAEIARQNKTPLSLVYSWLQRLEKQSVDEKTMDTLQKVRRQLRQVELTYDRLFLAESAGCPMPYHEVLLDLQEVLDAVRRDLPATDLANVEIACPPQLPPVRGDLYQLWFCFMTVLSHLLRFLPEDHRVRLTLATQGSQVTVEMVGFLPELVPVGVGGAANRVTLAETLTEVALGEEIIRRFMASHHGTFEKSRGTGDEVCFRLLLPAAKEA